MPEFSGWMNTDAVQFMPCPRCGAVPTENCQTPTGKRVTYVHVERTTVLVAKFGKEPWRVSADTTPTERRQLFEEMLDK